MDNPDQLNVDRNRSIAFIITHTVKHGQEKRYEDWQKETLQAVSTFPGYLGREVFRPAQGTGSYTTIVRFDSYEHLNAWAESDMRKSYVNKVRDLLERGDVHEIRTGIDFWFTPKGVRPPKPWKQFVLSVSAIYPLSLIVPRLLKPLFHVAPALGHPLVAGLLIAAILTALMTFVVMPRYTRLVKSWLYQETE